MPTAQQQHRFEATQEKSINITAVILAVLQRLPRRKGVTTKEMLALLKEQGFYNLTLQDVVSRFSKKEKTNEVTFKRLKKDMYVTAKNRLVTPKRYYFNDNATTRTRSVEGMRKNHHTKVINTPNVQALASFTGKDVRVSRF